MNGVNFDLSAYENGEACYDLIDEVSRYLFGEEVSKKLKKVNFISVLCDGSTDKNVTEQEVIYVIFVDPDTKLPVLKFFTVVVPESQDSVGIKQTITDCFQEHGLSDILERIVFIGSDGASVNSGKDSRLVQQFQEEFPYLVFIWCFSHRLERSLEDALKYDMEPINTSLMHLFYMYGKSLKKTCKLKKLLKSYAACTRLKVRVLNPYVQRVRVGSITN